MKKIIEYTKILVLALILVVGVSYIKAWTGPTLPAPLGNTSAPINTGSIHQEKTGTFWVNTTGSLTTPLAFEVFGQSLFNGATTVNGDISVSGIASTTYLKLTSGAGTGNRGKVLQFSDDQGNISWVATSSLGVGGGSSGGVTKIIAGTNISISPIGGTGAVTVSCPTCSTGSSGGGFTGTMYKCPNTTSNYISTGKTTHVITFSGCQGQYSSVSSCSILTDSVSGTVEAWLSSNSTCALVQ